MPPPRDSFTANDSGRAGRSNNNGPANNPPLVIVSERGRHSEASRRIVRAQAARASAAQSRETRARNREDRHIRERPLSPNDGTPSGSARPQPTPRPSHGQQQQQAQIIAQNLQQDPAQNQANTDSAGTLKPLVNWITNVLHLSASSFTAGAAALATAGRPQLGNANDVLSNPGGYISDSGLKMDEVQVTGGALSRQLPIALPRGFATLQTRISISDGFLVLLSRTACFDYASSGVENRLNELLFDVVMTSATAAFDNVKRIPEHPIQKHLRLACVCLTIFQGQRADGATFSSNHNYNLGLQAAWDEALVLDQDALKEPKSAEAALWAVFVISVTCGSTVKFFHQLLYNLCHDLQLFYWEQVRHVLLGFIYPGSFLDEPCRTLWYTLQNNTPAPQIAPIAG